MIVDSKKQKNIILENGKIHREIIESVKEFLVEGGTGVEINARAKEMLDKHDAGSAFLGQYGFPAHIIVCINDTVVHGIPDYREFESGDVITIDFGVKKNGICTDAAFTTIIGEPKDPEHQRCIDVANKALKKGIKAAKAGGRTGDVGSIIWDHVTKNGFHIIKSLTGHGLGETIHAQPTIYNYGNKGEGQVFKDGVYVAIEPIVGLTTGEVYEDDFAIKMVDGNIGVQEEHCGIVTKDGFEIVV